MKPTHFELIDHTNFWFLSPGDTIKVRLRSSEDPEERSLEKAAEVDINLRKIYTDKAIYNLGDGKSGWCERTTRQGQTTAFCRIYKIARERE